MSTYKVIQRAIRHLPLAILLFSFTDISGLYLCAQSTISGYVTGTVTDPSGAVVKAATIRLENTATRLSLSTAANSEGIYHFDFVPPGTYILSAALSGFSIWQETIAVTVGQSTTVNPRLKVGSLQNTVEVQADVAQIETESGNIATSYDERQNRLLPNPGQDLTYVAQTAPGAVMNTQNGGGNFSVFGLPGYSNMFTMT
ncbi:MAG TPA: carboxypeptidase-like regulatory domain-containing protein [Candidatus Sulfotelmatobacter sp.]